MSDYPAHIRVVENQNVIQTVEEHCLKTANYAKERLEGIGLGNTGYLAGLIHDMGKFSSKFRSYIEKSIRNENNNEKRVIHSFSGVIYILEKFHNSSFIDILTSEIIAYAIGSHHGLFDCVDLDSKNGFEYRLNYDKTSLCYEEAISNFFMYCISEKDVELLFKKSTQEINSFIQIKKTNKEDKTDNNFFLGLITRMILSAVIEGDRRDTFEFMSNKKIDAFSINRQVWNENLNYLELKLDNFNKSTMINKSRSEFSKASKEFANNKPGIFRLNLPTGAGKTLATLRYSLSHASLYNKKRIIFVIPLLSVIDQNAKVINDSIKNKELILEHHSNLIIEDDCGNEIYKDYQLLTQTWDSPIIITSMVQLLNTLFSHKTSAIRRMNSLCDSVIVIDEIQMIPYKTINMFNSTLNFLSEFCGATIVLSSATQPNLGQVKIPINYSVNCDVIPYNKELYEPFKRTRIINSIDLYGLTIENLSDKIYYDISNKSSVLTICNTKKSALTLYEQLKCLNKDNYCIYHLSTSMCMEHRLNTLMCINQHLSNLRNGKTNQKIICISTQLVEAGVDFSFEKVIRIVAGIDNIAQAAGRCNRNGEFDELCEVEIVKLKESDENLTQLQDIVAAKNSTISLVNDYKQNPEKYCCDLLSNISICEYYKKLFNNSTIKNQMDYPIKTQGINDTLYNLLSSNDKMKCVNTGAQYMLNQSFKTAAKAFKVFENNTTDIIVPYNDEAKSLICELCSEKSKYDLVLMKQLINKAKKYTISIYDYQKEELLKTDMLYLNANKSLFILNEQCYSPETGLTLDNINFI